jgi:hypothetical protein
MVSGAVRSAIAAGRGASPAIVRRWREGAEYRALTQAFADCPGEAEPVADRAERLFADAGWAGALLAPLIAALAADPFFEPPFRLSRDTVRTGAMLFESPALTLTASVMDAAAVAALPPPATVVFPGRITVTRYCKAGSAALRRWQAEPLDPDFSAATAPPCRPLPPLALADGAVHRCDGRTQAQLLSGARADLVMLVATIRAGAAPLMREYRADGPLVRVASADEGASRTEMLLGFVRRMNRADAGPRFEDATRDRAFHTRWTAMREWLALDARAALPRLAEMAERDPNAEVRAAAARTLATVRERVACHA